MDLEEHGGASLIEAEITDFDDKEPWLGKGFHGVGAPFPRRRGRKTVTEFRGEVAEGDGCRGREGLREAF